MKKLKILFKLSFKFFKKYFSQYFVLMLKPIVVTIIGLLSIFLAFISPLLAIVALFISIPCVCYGFWRGFIITYSLNIAALNFIKNNSNTSLSDCYNNALEKEKDFAKYVCFYALINILGFLPVIIYFFHLIPLTEFPFILNDPIILKSKLIPIVCLILVNTIILLPFLNYATQAFLFKKEENYIQLFLNCYKKLDMTGFLIALIINLIVFVLNYFFLKIYLLTFMIINVFVYSINTFWYYSRISKK